MSLSVNKAIMKKIYALGACLLVAVVLLHCFRISSDNVSFEAPELEELINDESLKQMFERGDPRSLHEAELKLKRCFREYKKQGEVKAYSINMDKYLVSYEAADGTGHVLIFKMHPKYVN